jgi:dTDP-4-dehydrorhamnose 3,5-epimerase
MKTINDAVYEIAETKNAYRYWFRRDFCELRHGQSRSVLITLEKASWGNLVSQESLPWNVRVEDRVTRQAWKLALISINNENKLYFERFIKSNNSVKSEIFSLEYLPDWLIEELEQVALEMKQRDINSEGENFLSSLVKQTSAAKETLKSKLSAQVEELSIGGLFRIDSSTRGDERGSFREVARIPEIELLTGYDFIGKQVNHSFSIYGTLRGFHVEPWAKLVTVISGLAVSYLIDCRPKSKTYGKIEKVFLGFGTAPDGHEVKGGALFIPQGIANSLLTLSPKLDYNYVVDDLWRPETATYAFNPFDPELNIPWAKFVSPENIIRSERDKTSPGFKEFSKNFAAHSP